MTIQIEAKVIKNIEVAENCYRILLSCLPIAKRANPGQFIEIKIADDYEPLLRRPFSIHRASGSNIEILYELVGQGTQLLSQRKKRDYLDIIGPLGNGFNYQLPITDYQLPILVAGGIGVAPLVFLAEKLAHSSKSMVHGKPIVLLGAKTKNQILCEKEFQRLGCGLKIATDDGSRGFKGKVTDLLKHLLSTMNHELSTIYACGPRPMLQEVSALSKKYKIPAQVSLEEHMACGIGACLGCVVNTRHGYQRVCKEGPVFGTDEIIW